MTDFTLHSDADGVATLTWDVAAKSMNVMSTEAFALLDLTGGDQRPLNQRAIGDDHVEREHLAAIAVGGGCVEPALADDEHAGNQGQ